MYQTRIANLNGMIENAESFYKTTYGDDSADGTGNTYRIFRFATSVAIQLSSGKSRGWR